MTVVTIRKHRKPGNIHSPWSPQQQAAKLTELIQVHEPHTLVTVSGNGCFYLLAEPYVTDQGERQWARTRLLGASYREAVLTLNRLTGASLDPTRGNSW